MGWFAPVLFRRLLAAAAVFGGAHSFSANLPPEVVTPLSSSTFEMGGAFSDVDLLPHFRDPDPYGTVVRVNVRLGSTVKAVDIGLYDQEKPITVANFLAYVNSGRFNANFFHRSVPGFIVQGGGFYWDATGGVAAVPPYAAIQNEPGISNLRGTVAMAKVADNPNSATSGWFVNLGDNSANLDAQNGGFTVFGRVIGNGMAVIDEVAALPIVDAGGPFNTLPVKDFTGGNVLRVHTVETDASVLSAPSPALTFTASSSDPELVDASVSGSTLRLSPAANRFGTATVTVSATDREGATTQATMTVQVLADILPLPAPVLSGAHTGAPVPATGSDGLPAGSVMTAFGTPAISDNRSLATRITIASGAAKRAGIYFENESGATWLVAWQGQQTSVPNATFKSFRDPLLSPSGAIAFIGTLSGVPASANDGLWTNVFGNLELVAREGAGLPGLPAVKVKSFTSTTFDDEALVAFVKLVRVPGSVTAANDVALVRIASSSSSTVLARTGTVVDGSTIKQISVLQPAARSVGQGRWTGSAGTVAKLTLLNRRVVIARILDDGTITVLLRTGVADANLGTTLATLGLPALGGTAVAVLATRAKQAGAITVANDAAMYYAADGTTFTQVVAEGSAGGNFASFSDPVANDQGALMFYGTKRTTIPRTPSVNALWISNGGNAPEMVARVGDTAVDRNGLPLPGTAWSAFPTFALPDGVGAGPVFVGQLAGSGVDAQSKLGLWARDSDGNTRMLLRAGQQFILPNGTKRVTNFTLLNALPGTYGARRSYNSTGSFAVLVTFADRSQAVLRLDVP